MARITYDIHPQQWQSLLEQSPVASWWQSADCLQMLERASDQWWTFAIGVTDDSRLRGVCIGYVTKCGILSRRAIISGGPLLAVDCTDEELTMLMQAVVGFCRSKKAIYVETRNFADYASRKEAFREAGFSYQPHYDITIDIASWRDNMHRSPKANIRKAISQNETWRVADKEQDMADWYVLLRRLYRTKVHRPLPPLALFMQTWQHHHTTLLVTEQDGHITGGALLTVMPPSSSRKARAYEWYKCGQIMATYAALEWCEQQDIEIFDLMGAGAPGVPYGVRDFKVQIGGELHEYGRYLAILKPFPYNLGKTVIRLRG